MNGNIVLTLEQYAYIIGGFFVAVHVWALLRPSLCHEFMLSFPRNAWWGRLLAAIDIAWVTYVVTHASLGRFEFLKPYVYVAGPVSYVLIIIFLDELLAPRALGGFLLLIANPILNAARWNDSSWRLVLTVLAYVWVVSGILLMLSPFRFRKTAALVLNHPVRYRAVALGGLLLGGLILILGYTTY